MIPVLILICAPVLLWALHDLVRRPILRRQALRNLVRRPTETVIVLVGALLGTAIITASFIVGDTVDGSIRDIARTELGPIDEAIIVTDAEDLDRAAAALVSEPIADTDGVLTMRRGGATAASIGADGASDRRGVPRVRVFEVDFDDARAFGNDVDATGLRDAGPTPRPGHVAIGAETARQLDVSAGDDIDLFVYGRQERVQVDVVLPAIGLAGRGEESVFVAPGSLAGWHAGATTDLARPPTGEILVSNTGGVFAGADLTRSVMAELEARVDAFQAANPDIEVDVDGWKEELLLDAEAEGNELTTIFSSIGAFAVIAGILLVVNIVVMLAEERRNQLGVLRSLGLKRNQVIRVFGLEGTFYAVAASIVGAVAGIGVGYVVAVFARSLLESDGLVLDFSMQPSSLVTGGLIGLVVTLATVWGASIPLASLNVISAIRDLPAPRSAKRRLRGLLAGGVALLAGVALTLLGISGGSAIPALIGPPIACFGAIAPLSRIIGGRAASTILGATGAAWGILAFTALPETMRDPEISVFVCQGVVLVAGTVLVLTVNSSLWQRALGSIGGGSTAVPIRLGLTYPLARPGRTGMLLGMYSLVIFTIMFMGVFSAVFSAQADDLARDSSAGYDVIVDTNVANPPTLDEVSAIDGVQSVAPLIRAGVDLELILPGGIVDRGGRPLTGVDEAFFVNGGPTLDTMADEYDDAAAVFADLLARDDVALAGPFLFGDDGPGGSRITPGTEMVIVNGATATRQTVTVIGVVSNDWVWNGLIVNDGLASEVLGERAVASRLYVEAAANTDPADLAAVLNGTLLENGADARSFVADVESEMEVQNGFIRILQGYLGLGLAIGVAGLGIVLVRAVRERRREIGMLRAMGYQSSTIRRAFVVEALFIAAQGAIVGVGLGILSGWQVVTNADAFGTSQPGFTVPFGTTLLILVGPVVASLLAAAGPARQAAAIRPAVALRVTG